MEMILLLARQNVLMALYLLIGYLLFRRKLISVQGSAELGKILLYVIMPMAIVNSYLREFSVEILSGFLFSLLAAAAALLLSMAVSALFFRKKSPVRQFGAAFSNAGFIGIPLVQAVLGSEAVFYIASFIAFLNILQWTYGVFLMTRSREAISAKKILTNPIVISFVVGLLLFFLPVKLPSVLTSLTSTLSQMSGPLAMMVLGTYLAQIRLAELFTSAQSYLCCLVRLLIIPALTILPLTLAPESMALPRMAILLAAAAPVGSNIAIFAQLYGQSYTEAVKDVCLSTVLSIVTLPLMVWIAGGIW